MNLKSIFFLVIVCLLLVTGCISEKKEDANVNKEFATTNLNRGSELNNKRELSSEEEMNLWFSIGSKMKLLSEVPDIDSPSILVNGRPITKRSIESYKILNNVSDSYSLKKAINSLIRIEVIQSEAVLKKIEPSFDQINAYVEQQKQTIVEYMPASVVGYMKGMEITQDEYFAMIEKQAYDMFQREALWSTIKIKKEKKIQKEATERNLSYNKVENEYYEKYIDELIKKADIEFLDDEIKKLLKK